MLDSNTEGKFSNVTDGQVVAVNENQNLEIECISSNIANDVTLTQIQLIFKFDCNPRFTSKFQLG